MISVPTAIVHQYPMDCFGHLCDSVLLTLRREKHLGQRESIMIIVGSVEGI